MAKERMLNTRIWSDNWMSQLDPIEKLLFLYFLTNSYTNISGIYEMPVKIAAVETGIDPTMIDKVLTRLHPKVITINGWVILPNFPKYQNLRSGDVVKGIQREFLCAPEQVQELAKRGGWGEGLGIVPTPTGDTKLNLTQLISEVKTSQEPFRVEKATDEDKEVKTRTKTDLTYRKVFELWSKYPLNWRANRTEIAAAKNILAEHSLEEAKNALAYAKEYAHEEKCPQILKPSDLDRKWINLQAFRDKR